jgi:hypothetical protein
VTIWKRMKRLWTLLTTEEVFYPDGTSAGQCAGRLGPRVGDHLRGRGTKEWIPVPTLFLRRTLGEGTGK